ncbi:unnamed protein product [Rhizophagus irregularis]|nr:unnamed protein product [Rhizophagus irregularis]
MSYKSKCEICGIILDIVPNQEILNGIRDEAKQNNQLDKSVVAGLIDQLEELRAKTSEFGLMKAVLPKVQMMNIHWKDYVERWKEMVKIEVLTMNKC